MTKGFGDIIQIMLLRNYPHHTRAAQYIFHAHA